MKHLQDRVVEKRYKIAAMQQSAYSLSVTTWENKIHVLYDRFTLQLPPCKIQLFSSVNIGYIILRLIKGNTAGKDLS